MNKKTVLDIQTQIADTHARIKNLEQILIDNAPSEIQNSAAALLEQKHALLMDTPLDMTAFDELNARLTVAIEADKQAAEALKDKQALNNAVELRIDEERTRIASLTQDHKVAISEMLQADADKRAADRDAAILIYRQKAYEIAAIEETQRNVLGQPEGFSPSANQTIIGALWNEKGYFTGDTIGKAVAAEVTIIKTNLIKSGVTL